MIKHQKALSSHLSHYWSSEPRNHWEPARVELVKRRDDNLDHIICVILSLATMQMLAELNATVLVQRRLNSANQMLAELNAVVLSNEG